ncbi:glycosyltransferase family 2 protein [Nocardioides rotundus]|uniref:glycosyltransferase family 2 protein n=2 Tax=Bacteria TaxID=2 RepID=UPI001CBAA885|nr:glycosyltransferase family 2 protein [Nocardioides rotundus]UAL30689.1 glycosyltransferase family 2 protein [Nocardioides rotundus]
MTAAPDVLDKHAFLYSVVIPVYNSEAFVGRTVDEVVRTFREAGLRLELVLVNDGSPDNVWPVLEAKAQEYDEVVALNLLHNYGQHTANLAGFRESRGDYVITMDDDLQNPPDQALVLIDKAMEGYDCVFAQFEQKQAAGYRRLGTKVIGMMNKNIFGLPDDLVVSNFRILRRDVVDRISASRTAHPYITGQALLYSSHRANVLVRHESRAEGQSNYSFSRILKLVLTILFSYSSWPLRTLATIGFGVAGVGFLIGAVYLVLGLLGQIRTPGWTSTIVLLSVFNGFTIGMLSMLGEYLVRTLNAVSATEIYHLKGRAE